jgi:hypothetical protein
MLRRQVPVQMEEPEALGVVEEARKPVEEAERVAPEVVLALPLALEPQAWLHVREAWREHEASLSPWPSVWRGKLELMHQRRRPLGQRPSKLLPKLRPVALRAEETLTWTYLFPEFPVLTII